MPSAISRAALAAALLLDPASALLSAQCCASSRVSLSRVAAPALRVPLTCMCVEAPPAPEEASAEVVAEEAAPARRGRAKTPKTPLEELEVGAELQGTVRSVQSYGAFVDVGAATDGLLHVSEIADEYVADASEKLSVGDAVTVRIKGINLEKKQLAFTCKDPNAEPAQRGGGKPRGGRASVDLSKFAGADEKEFITGTVRRVQEFGAFVEIEAGVDGLVHISQIKDGGVATVDEALSIGQEVQVRIINVDPGKGRIGLSMRPWVAEEDRPKREKRGGGDRDAGFGDEDAEYKASAEELESMVGGDLEVESVFDAAFNRMEGRGAAKAEGKKFHFSVL